MNDKSVIIMGSQSPALPRGRLMFALDATASRAPTWAIARELQARMFREAAPIGKLDVQLVFYRGDECRTSKWVSSGVEIAHLMNRIDCKGGYTQIRRVLEHALRENEKAAVQALVFIGDAMEEQIETLAAAAGELGMQGVPIFIFQEGRNAAVRRAFRAVGSEIRGSLLRVQPGQSPGRRATFRTTQRGSAACRRRC